MIGDTELLRRYVEEHSEPAFASLVQRYVGLVYSAALRRTNGDAALAEDVTQRVFALLAGEAARLQRHTVLSGWLYVATRHSAANEMRAEKRRKLREEEAHAMQEISTPDPSWNQLRPELDSVMDELKAPDRDAVLLRYFENRPFAEIGSAFRISEDAARMRVDRALEKLRVLLAQRGIHSTAAALGTVLATQAAGAAPTGLAAFATSSALSGAETIGSATSGLGVFSAVGGLKVVLTAAGVMALISVGTAVYHYESARETRTSLSALQLAHAGLQQQLQRQAERAWEAEENSRVADSRIAVAEETQGLGKSAGTNERATLRPVGNTLDILMADPTYQKISVKQYASTLRFRYAALYRKLGWPPATITAFENFKVKEYEALNDTMAAARSEGVSVVEPTLKTLMKPTNFAFSEELRRLIGDSAYSAYLNHNEQFSARTAVEALAGLLQYSATPVTVAQTEQLTRIIATNTPRVQSNGLVGVSRPTDWDTVFSQAEGVLGAAQLESLRAVAEKTRATQELHDRAQSLLRAAAAAAPAGPTK